MTKEMNAMKKKAAKSGKKRAKAKMHDCSCGSGLACSKCCGC